MKILPLLDLAEPIARLPIDNTMPLSTLDQIAYTIWQSVSKALPLPFVMQFPFILPSLSGLVSEVATVYLVTWRSPTSVLVGSAPIRPMSWILFTMVAICYQPWPLASSHYHVLTIWTSSRCREWLVGDRYARVNVSCHHAMFVRTYSDIFKRLSSRTKECWHYDDVADLRKKKKRERVCWKNLI